jgi:hypothetical protein
MSPAGEPRHHGTCAGDFPTTLRVECAERRERFGQRGVGTRKRDIDILLGSEAGHISYRDPAPNNANDQ